MKNFYLAISLLFLCYNSLFSQQFDLSAELRPRYESRNGYKTLAVKDQGAGNFISQRTRLNFDYLQDKVKVGVTLQNVRVWGDVGTLASDDKATSLHQAWAEVMLNDKWAFKLGRQEIVYDDHRIFGNVGWAQQARSHDAFLVKYRPNQNHKVDIGFALNADGQNNVDVLYSNVAGYKTFQYLWYHGNFNDFGLSFLALNTGVEYEDNQEQKLSNMLTVGPRLTYKNGKFKINFATYFQSGKKGPKDVSASYFGGNIGYGINDNFSIGVGMEYLSGTDMTDTSGKSKSFAPLFGTNHKFNGWMDYFYVGNHFNSVGLSDINAMLAFKKGKFSAKLIPHFFSSAASVVNAGGDSMDNNLGTEVDFTVGYKFSPAISFNAGFSKMLATETMEVLKGGSKDESNSWGWVMFTFKPKLFSINKSSN